MRITIFDQIILLLTGVIAVYMVYYFFREYNSKKTKQEYYLWYMASFGVLFVAGVLIVLFGFGVLGSPLIKVVATLIPFGIAIGLVHQFYYKYYHYYLSFLFTGFLLIMLENFGVFQTRTVYPVFHAIAGLTIFLVPIVVARSGQVGYRFIWVGIGGALIGIGGMTLASLGFGQPLMGVFTSEVVFAILAPILLLMSMSFAYGFEKKVKINNISTS